MQPTGATFDSFRQSPGVGMAKGAWGRTATPAGVGASHVRRKKTLLGLAIMAGGSILSWAALFALTGLI